MRTINALDIYNYPSFDNYVVATSSNTGSIYQTINDLNVTGKLTLNGQNVGDMLAEIYTRLAIITPDNEKMSKFPALQKAYEHYKLVEALCQEQSNNDTSST